MPDEPDPLIRASLATQPKNQAGVENAVSRERQAAFRRALSSRTLLYDGSKGTLLALKGLEPGEFPDLCNLTRPGDVLSIHAAYIGAGADAIQTNTLQASRFHLEARGILGQLDGINRAGARLAREAADECEALAGRRRVFVAGSVGPTGRMLAPAGDLTFDSALAAFSEQIRSLLDGGVDALHFETFTDLAELRAAVLAARYCCAAPVVATLSFGRRGATAMGDTAEAAADALAGLGVDCLGANCGLEPEGMLAMFGRLAGHGAPLCAKPNAGCPEYGDGAAVYGASAQAFHDAAFGFARLGARLIGGCCGSGPSHVAAMREAVDEINAGASRAREIGGAQCESPDVPRTRQTAAERGQKGDAWPSADFRDLAGMGSDGAEAEIIDRLVDAGGGVPESHGGGVPEAHGAGVPESHGGGARLAMHPRVLAMLPRGEGLARAVAELSRLYAKAPLAFAVDCDGEREGLPTLLAALERYCGRAAVAVPAHWSPASREALRFYGAAIIEG